MNDAKQKDKLSEQWKASFSSMRLRDSTALAVITAIGAMAMPIAANSVEGLKTDYASAGFVISDLSPTGSSQGLTPTGGSANGWRLAVGRRFGEHFSAELHYTNAGCAPLGPVEGTTTTYNNAQIAYSAPGVSVNYHIMPTGSRWNTFARAGVSALSLRAKDGPADLEVGTKHDTQLTFGFGAIYKFTNDYSVTFAHDMIDKDAEWTSVSTVMSFGRLAKSDIASIPSTAALTECSLPKTLRTQLHFATGSDQVMPDDEAKLLMISMAMPAGMPVLVTAEGHADWVGSDADNQALSESRASSVIKALYAMSQDTQGWNPKEEGFGEHYAKSDVSSPISRAESRRVDLRIECPRK